MFVSGFRRPALRVSTNLGMTTFFVEESDIDLVAAALDVCLILYILIAHSTILLSHNWNMGTPISIPGMDIIWYGKYFVTCGLGISNFLTQALNIETWLSFAPKFAVRFLQNWKFLIFRVKP